VVQEPSGEVLRVVEWADADAAERGIGLCNAGVVCAPAADLLRWLRRLRNDNSKGEYYLTDAVALARADGRRVGRRGGAGGGAPRHQQPGRVGAGGGDRRRRPCARRPWTAAPPSTAPETVFLSWDTRLGQDVTVAPNVVFGPGVVVEDGAEIHAFSHLAGCTVRRGASVGPFARLRPGAEVGPRAHVGNFVEMKAALLGEGAKANHLSYLGDAVVGRRRQHRAGTITCNYDGAAKHRTEIGEGAFIGSDTALVAPVRVGARALVAAGSVVTEDVPDDAMALARGRQVNKPGRGVKPKKGSGA
jgi:bifunctional UDP-N-acetylglucosamine pyrophosphorylase/glucosamine-1-phosphate N-acetyltransferase